MATLIAAKQSQYMLDLYFTELKKYRDTERRLLGMC